MGNHEDVNIKNCLCLNNKGQWMGSAIRFNSACEIVESSIVFVIRK